MPIFKNKTKKSKGFTLVEVLIASGVLSLFLVGVFSFYRMGSRMFISGSWKLNKQKEAERFLSILKERIEQASNASSITLDPGEKSIASMTSTLATLNKDTTIDKIAGKNPVNKDTRIMLFAICKPDMMAITNTPGMILYHSLMLSPEAKNLYTLRLHANTSRVAHNGIDYFNTSAVFDQPSAGALQKINSSAKFNAVPQTYNLGKAPYTAKLTNVKGITINWGVALGTDTAVLAEKVIEIKLEFQNPGHEKTRFSQSIEAKIDYAVPLKPFAVGAL
jgi:prepilin-type N-terminal cleavage/methylation domain-containing protein